MVTVKINENITQCTVCKNCTHAYFHAQLKLFLLVFLLQHFQYILQLIYELISFYIYSFHSLNIHQHHMVYHIHTHNYYDPNKSFISYTLIDQLFTFIFTHAFILIPTLFIITNTVIQSTIAFTRFMPFYVSCFIDS